MARVQPKFKVAIDRWTSKCGVQDYKTYAMIICMFMPKFLDGLPQPLGNNPWPTLLTNWNYRTCFFKQCDYLLGILSECSFFIESEVCQNWPNVENQILLTTHTKCWSSNTIERMTCLSGRCKRTQLDHWNHLPPLIALKLLQAKIWTSVKMIDCSGGHVHFHKVDI